MPSPEDKIALFGIRGRWGTDRPYECPESQVLEAQNVDWYKSSLGRKRPGAETVALTGGTAQTGVISSLFSHVPNDDQTERELWSIDDAATPRWKRLAGGTSHADVTVANAIASRSQDVVAVGLNGKLFFAFDSTVNRLHCWDPADSAIRVVGLKKSAAPSVADQGAGSYAATIRYYRVAYRVKSGSDVLRQSNPSAAQSFTPSGTGASARVTKPAALSEGETHWAIFGSADDGNYVELTELAVGTTTYDDTTAPSAYDGTAMHFSESFNPPPSAKYLIADDSRIIMGGAWESAAGDSLAPSSRRIWWTSRLGATDKGDDERVSNTSAIKSYLDLDEPVTGLAGPLMGSIYAFSYDSQWKLVPTPTVSAPYVRFRITGGVGCIAHKTIVIAEDEAGNPALYWLSQQGPYRRGANGQQSLVEDIRDIWDTVNLDAANVVAHGVYHKDLHQIWWWIATDDSDDPDTKIVFDTRLGRVVENNVVRGGWAVHDGDSAAARCSTMMSDTLGASMGRDLKPYIGESTGTSILKCDTGTTDNGTEYQAYMNSRPYNPWGLGQTGGAIEDAMLVAKAAAGVSVELTITADFKNTHKSTAILTPRGTATRVYPTFSNSRVADANTVQYKIGDSEAVDNSWNLDALIAKFMRMGHR